VGLSISVGLVSRLRVEGDAEAVEYFEQQFEVINELLESFGLPPHAEPPAPDFFNVAVYGDGLHYLRRVAAHLALEEELPPPGDEEAAADDPLLREYYQLYDESLADGKAALMGFQHLIIHADAQGFYLPVEFDEVLHVDPSLEVAGDSVGSSHRLLAECMELARALELPDDLDPEADEVWDAADQQGDGDGDEKWRRYGVESQACLALIRACRASITAGAAAVFIWAPDDDEGE
jgi:hypothetical protein